MPVSPQDFELWARLTGNEYPRNVHERAALAPEVHNFTRNLGRKGGVRDIARISYDQPDAVAHPNADSLIQAPVTPDNRIPKVAGTHDQSLTSQHYENEQAGYCQSIQLWRNKQKPRHIALAESLCFLAKSMHAYSQDKHL
jgi:hypothetical protein